MVLVVTIPFLPPFPADDCETLTSVSAGDKQRHSCEQRACQGYSNCMQWSCRLCMHCSTSRALIYRQTGDMHTEQPTAFSQTALALLQALAGMAFLHRSWLRTKCFSCMNLGRSTPSLLNFVPSHTPACIQGQGQCS
jgi:hypothetical protein